MNPFTAVGVAASALLAACSLAVRPRIWGPYLVVLVVQAAGLALVVSFHEPAVLPIGLPLVQLLGGDDATRYLAFHLALPSMMGRYDHVVSVVVTSIATGIATVLFARAFGLVGSDGAWHRALRRAPALVVVGALTTGAFVAMRSLHSLVPEDAFTANRALYFGREALDLAVFVVIQSFFAYTTAWIVLGGRRIFTAIVDSIRVTARTLMPTLLVVGIPAALLYPLHFVAGRSDLIVGRFKPEIVTVLLSARLVADVLAMFIVVGAITRLYTWRMRHTT